jgi:hypothetical protein
MEGQTATVDQVIPDFLRHETDGSAQLDVGKPSLTQIEDRFGANVKELGDLDGCP